MRISDWSSDVCSSDLAEAFRIARLQPTPELLRQARFGQIRDVRGHAGDGQAGGGRVAYVVIIAATPTGIGHDRLPPALMKSDVLGTVTSGGGDVNGRLHPVGKEAGPTQYLHSTHGTANDCPHPFDTHIVQQHRLRANQDRKSTRLNSS